MNQDHKSHDKEAEEAITSTVEKHGWFVAKFKATNYQPSFAYTIGLWKNFGHPELIVFGLGINSLQGLLNAIGEYIQKGESIEAGKYYDDFIDGHLSTFLEVHPSSIKDYFGYGMWFNEYKEFKALQMVWPDRQNHFPWDEEAEQNFRFTQPLLDRNHSFKFPEEKNLAVFTNKQHLEENKPILYVIHEEDGDWQFLTGDELSESDAKVVALEQMVKRDPSLNELFNLERGEEAERSSLQAKWIRNKIIDPFE